VQIYNFVFLQNIFFNLAKIYRNRKTISVIVLRICVKSNPNQEFPLKNHEKTSLANNEWTNKNCYCFKHLKITLLWQKSTI